MLRNENVSEEALQSALDQIYAAFGPGGDYTPPADTRPIWERLADKEAPWSRVRSKAWIDKLIVSRARNRRRQSHARLSEQLARNRGAAMGLPLPSPVTNHARKAAARRSARAIRANAAF